MRNFIKFLLIIIAIIVFVAIVWASLGLAAPAFLSSFPLLTSIFSWAATFVATSPWWAVALAAFGALAVITPEGAEAIGERLGEAAEVVGSAAGEVVSGGAEGLVDGLTSGGGLALLALVGIGFWLWTRDKDETTKVVIPPKAEEKQPIERSSDPAAQPNYLPAEPAGSGA